MWQQTGLGAQELSVFRWSPLKNANLSTFSLFQTSELKKWPTLSTTPTMHKDSGSNWLWRSRWRWGGREREGGGEGARRGRGEGGGARGGRGRERGRGEEGRGRGEEGKGRGERGKGRREKGNPPSAPSPPEPRSSSHRPHTRGEDARSAQALRDGSGRGRRRPITGARGSGRDAVPRGSRAARARAPLGAHVRARAASPRLLPARARAELRAPLRHAPASIKAFVGPAPPARAPGCGAGDARPRGPTAEGRLVV